MHRPALRDQTSNWQTDFGLPRRALAPNRMAVGAVLSVESMEAAAHSAVSPPGEAVCSVGAESLAAAAGLAARAAVE